jgi:hypothetical protein
VTPFALVASSGWLTPGVSPGAPGPGTTPSAAYPPLVIGVTAHAWMPESTRCQAAPESADRQIPESAAASSTAPSGRAADPAAPAATSTSLADGSALDAGGDVGVSVAVPPYR